MLMNLHVKNLAIIEEVEVDFSNGLNIISGETGAGKSIIIGSINIALGGKIPKDIIRKGSEYALIELIFEVKSDEVLNKISNIDIPVEDGLVIISRKIMHGRSISRINGEVVTNNNLRKISSLLIDIHGQHDNQMLLQKRNHLDIVDKYGKDDIFDLKEIVSNQYKEYFNIKKELDDSLVDEDKRIREISFLEYEIKEIRDAQLKEGEDEELFEKYKVLSNSKNIIEEINKVHELIMSAEEKSVNDNISRAIKCLGRICELDSKLNEKQQQLLEIDCLINDFSNDISDYLDDIENNEEEFYRIEERLNTINSIKSKYGNSIKDILLYCEQCEEKLIKLVNYDEYVDQLKQKLMLIQEKLEKSCKKLSLLRKKDATELAHKIEEALIDLNFLDIKFRMDFDKLDHYTEYGFDSAEFMISTNPGESIKPLSEVASGGELSRVMLAIKSVLAGTDVIDTMIFDEIDAGISGRTAQKVSEKLSLISQDKQVICITHLPQIAAMADSHYVIEKKSDMKTTCTDIRKLKQDEAVNEIARIIGGAQITENVMINAREMITLAQKTKNNCI